MGLGNESLNKWSRSHGQYGRHAHKKSFSLEPKGWWLWKLVCTIGYFNTTKFVQMMTLGCPWPILRQGQIWSLILLYGKKVKQWIFLETVVFHDIKVGRLGQLNEYMNIKGQGHSLTLVQITQIQYLLTSFPQKPLILTYTQHSGERYRTNGPLFLICISRNATLNLFQLLQDLFHKYAKLFMNAGTEMAFMNVGTRTAPPHLYSLFFFFNEEKWIIEMNQINARRYPTKWFCRLWLDQ